MQEQHDGGQCSTYLYDPNEAWSPLARIDHLHDDKQGEIYWFSTDLNGAPLEVTDVRGNVRWSGHYGSFGEVRHQTAGFTGALQHTALAHQPLRYAGQYADSETGLHYNLFRYYDPQVGRFIVQDPIGLNGGWNLYQYAPNPLRWIDPLGLKGEKPSNSPDMDKWLNKGGSVWTEMDGTWVYRNKDGAVVRYPNGYPDFSPYAIQETNVPDLKGNHGKNPGGDFGKADALAPNGPADYRNNTWHHHQNGTTMQEVPKNIHGEFTHKGGVSNIKCGGA